MGVTIDELYDHTVRPLPTAERLKLARLILDDLAANALVDFREDWSDEDLQDLARDSWQRATNAPGERDA